MGDFTTTRVSAVTAAAAAERVTALRVRGRDTSGWVLYQIVPDNGQESGGVAPRPNITQQPPTEDRYLMTRTEFLEERRC